MSSWHPNQMSSINFRLKTRNLSWNKLEKFNYISNFQVWGCNISNCPHLSLQNNRTLNTWNTFSEMYITKNEMGLLYVQHQLGNIERCLLLIRFARRENCCLENGAKQHSLLCPIQKVRDFEPVLKDCTQGLPD